MNPLTYKAPSTGPLTVEVSATSIHSEQVLQWREEAFRRMGFLEFIADFLASTRIDLHQMEKLLKAGCPHTTAAEILMGTAWHGEDEQWRWTSEGDLDCDEDSGKAS